ncbi:TMV resistance protein N-like isoform X2 [Momordica charantia]|uniref:TMV resistance protein N-like isoform X2 n=1 Tax=Momordica charantia TaxID=3673 RepID=A0A6J1DR26_MOMCH|nr:TMV resistance protein N-like isoform X2 [Momordica charantia]
MADRKADGGRWMYDVFLSFRSENTRKNFTDHLYHALRDAGINVFRDENEIPRGEHITTELEQAIQRSKIAIIVFSKGYADSRWCLEELVKIMECRRTLNQLVLPVFYDVDPSDVRNQKGSFGEAFSRYQLHFGSENYNKILSWRMALTEAANLAGFNLENIADGHEGKFIKKIIQKVSRDLKRIIDVAHHLVGIDFHVNAITSKLGVGLGGVRMVGIWGMGGVGKTTIAKAVYNLLYDDFDGACFLDNIKDTSEQLNGLVHLQEKLLKSIFKSSKIELQYVHEGITQLQQRLPHKKVLLILDDIDDMGQLNALARSRCWFGAGTRIIITTRNEHFLKNFQVDAICTIDEMNENEALELFSWHAFHNKYPSVDYCQLSKRVVSYCGGLPLALEVLGSFLYGRTVLEWEDALNKLKKIPLDEISRKLKTSFDGLGDQAYKDIFLDISCFFIGMDKSEVTRILDGCGFFPIIGISVLLQRRLLRVDHENKFRMHDLLRDMGREIVHNESRKEPAKRSRIFVNDDVLDVLEKQKGADVTEGLSLKLSISSKKNFHTKAFSEMQKLRLLQLNYARIRGDFKHISQELRWICWHGFPLESLPKSFHLEKAVAIDLRYSHLIKFFQKEPKFSLEKLTILNLSHSRYLTCTPNFSKLPHLQKLELEDCKSLVKVDDSIGCLQKLGFINLKDCICLNKLPEAFCELKSLERLILSGCSKLEKLPNELGKMESLTTLAADGTCIQELPSTIVGLKKLKCLSITRSNRLLSKSLAEILWSRIFPSKFSNSIVLPMCLQGFKSLTILRLRNCNVSDDAIPKDIGSLVSLMTLDLGGNDFDALPSSISCLSNLYDLNSSGCSKLEQILNLPPYSRWIDEVKCKALENISELPKNVELIEWINVAECPKVVEISSFDGVVPYIPSIKMSGGHSKLNQSFKQIFQRMFEEINGGIKVCSFPDGAVSEESSWSLHVEASQIADFDFEGADIESIMYHCPVGLRTNDWWFRNDELPKVGDGGNGTHIIGKTCFEFSGGSSNRCILIRKRYYDVPRHED